MGLLQPSPRTGSPSASFLHHASYPNHLFNQAATAHCRRLVISEFLASLHSPTLSPSLRSLLTSLLLLLASSWVLEAPHSFLRHCPSLSFPLLDLLTSKRLQLLASLRPLSVNIVDSFEFRDEVLGSSLGAADGWVYHRL